MKNERSCDQPIWARVAGVIAENFHPPFLYCERLQKGEKLTVTPLQPPGLDQLIHTRAQTLLDQSRHKLYCETDRWFGHLMVVQWLAGIAAAAWWSPLAWNGTASSVHEHVWLSILLGGWLSAPPAILAWCRPGRLSTRYVIASAQMLMSSLLIHLTGGRIETHFHIFGSLAFLAFYRDWRVLIPATMVVVVDHFLRGTLYPLSVFGVVSASHWRWLEHAGWVVFEDLFLIKMCIRSSAEMMEIAEKRAHTEEANITIEHEVQQRTAELRETEAMFRALVESANTGIVIGDAQGRIVTFNPKAEEAFGWSQEDITGQSVTLLLPERLRVSYQSLFAEVRSNRRQLPKTTEVVGLRKSGIEFPIGTAFSTWEVGERVFFSAMFRDLSERRQLENQLAQAQKLESMGQLAAGIAHEINTPIQYVGDNTRFLQDAFNDLLQLSTACEKYFDDLDLKADSSESLREVANLRSRVDVGFLQEETPRAIDQTLEGISRVATIVRAMKEFSHPGAQEKVPADLNRAIHNATIVSKNEWKYVADLIEDFDPELPAVPCFAAEFNQVMLNLIVNAAHAISDVAGKASCKGVITIRTRKVGDWVQIDVQDTGTGIAESVRSHVFNLFFTTKEVGRGTGQGLAFAYASIAKKHAGKIFFDTEVGSGTTFSIRLPLSGMEQVPS
jgi:PAS domain S-box-containing protein